jgi:hypothetical protein
VLEAAAAAFQCFRRDLTASLAYPRVGIGTNCVVDLSFACRRCCDGLSLDPRHVRGGAAVFLSFLRAFVVVRSSFRPWTRVSIRLPGGSSQDFGWNLFSNLLV